MLGWTAEGAAHPPPLEREEGSPGGGLAGHSSDGTRKCLFGDSLALSSARGKKSDVEKGEAARRGGGDKTGSAPRANPRTQLSDQSTVLNVGT